MVFEYLLSVYLECVEYLSVIIPTGDFSLFWIFTIIMDPVLLSFMTLHAAIIF
jgi:ABC-type multidrug transport system permease subunit